MLAVLERAARALGIAGEAGPFTPGGDREDTAAAQQQQGGGDDDGRGEAARRRPRPQAAPPGLRQRAPPGAAGAVDAAAVEMLVSMGFDEASATSALYQAGGDVTLAAELLLAAA